MHGLIWPLGRPNQNRARWPNPAFHRTARCPRAPLTLTTGGHWLLAWRACFFSVWHWQVGATGSDLTSHSRNNHGDNCGRNAARRHVSTTHRETCWDPSAGSFGYLFNAVPFLAHLESSAAPFRSPSPQTVKERECGEGKEAVGVVEGGGDPTATLGT
jgi:hypothetical protein